MLKIWGRHNSRNVRKVLWCAEEVGVAYESIEAGGAFGRTADPAYRALNPNGLVPAIEDDGLALWESNAIVCYLAARYAPDTLYPQDTAVRAGGDKWMDWTSSFAGAFRNLFWGTLRTVASGLPQGRDYGADLSMAWFPAKAAVQVSRRRPFSSRVREPVADGKEPPL